MALIENVRKWVVLVHGGAGAMRTMSAAKEAQYRAGLETAVRAGVNVLNSNGLAVDAAIAAVSSMEQSCAFNAGHGSCLSEAGRVEADAAVMDGRDLSYGGVAAIPDLGNAVWLADAVRRHSPHCLFAGQQALASLAALPGVDCEFVEPSEERLTQFRVQKEKRFGTNVSEDDLADMGGTHDEGDTVGAVVLDTRGHLAAAVSTGGLWLKASGRVGDSPVAGAGLWAEDEHVACATTGTGEFILRGALASELKHYVQRGLSIEDAGDATIEALRSRFGPGRAGLIGVSPQGGITTAFDTAGMGRAWLREGESTITVRVWPEEDD